MTTNKKVIFIVPYRDRAAEKTEFIQAMSQQNVDMEIYFVHQADNRPFNRGAMKNIGFLFLRDKYRDSYANTTFVFNDVDTYPRAPLQLNYATTPGFIKHFYGFRHALGGIVSICGADFERIGGFPNLWAWGYEDNMLQMRALQAKLTIDRSQFYPIHDNQIVHSNNQPNSNMRLVSQQEFFRAYNNQAGGFASIHQAETKPDINSDKNCNMIHVSAFECEAPVPNANNLLEFDLRNGEPWWNPATKYMVSKNMKNSFNKILFHNSL